MINLNARIMAFETNLANILRYNTDAAQILDNAKKVAKSGCAFEKVEAIAALMIFERECVIGYVDDIMTHYQDGLISLEELERKLQEIPLR